MLLVRLRTDNDAMQDPVEVANTLRELADRIEKGAKSGLIRDINGNLSWSFAWSVTRTER